MKTILATAYAINPYKGSEDGMGWNFVLQIARYNKVIAITRRNNRAQIESYMAEKPDPRYANIQFQYFDLPYWMRFWKRGGRGAMLYYTLWQRGIIPFIRKQKLEADIVHNLNFHNDWTPSYLWKLRKPFVWGPVGHHPLIPAQYLAESTIRQRWTNRLTWWIKQYFWKLSPALRKTVRKADHILCMNTAVPAALGIRSAYSIMPSVATEDAGWITPEDRGDKFTLISAGRLVPLKGFDLSLRAFARFHQSLNSLEQSRCELLLIGSGPEENKLRMLAETLGIAKATRFIQWMPRHELMQQYKQASAFLFTSHEGAGMVVAEALSFGLPVICLDNEGPGQFIDKNCGIAIGQSDVQTTIQGLATAIGELFNDPEKIIKMSHVARAQFERQFQWSIRGEQLQHIYNNL